MQNNIYNFLNQTIQTYCPTPESPIEGLNKALDFNLFGLNPFNLFKKITTPKEHPACSMLKEIIQNPFVIEGAKYLQYAMIIGTIFYVGKKLSTSSLLNSFHSSNVNSDPLPSQPEEQLNIQSIIKACKFEDAKTFIKQNKLNLYSTQENSEKPLGINLLELAIKGHPNLKGQNSLNDSKRFIQYLAEKNKFQINTPLSDKGNTLLHNAAHQNDLYKILVQNGASEQATNDIGATPKNLNQLFNYSPST